VREIEFLPDWYPKVRKRKRMVALQAWVTLTLMCGLGSWMLLVQRNVHAREIELKGLRTDLNQSETELARWKTCFSFSASSGSRTRSSSRSAARSRRRN
jgi:hypothetical protein